MTDPILAQLSSEYRRTDGGYNDGGAAQLQAQVEARLAGLITPVNGQHMAANLDRLIWTKTGPQGPEAYKKGVNNAAPYWFEVIGTHGVALPSVTLGDSDDARTLWPRMSDREPILNPKTGELVAPRALLIVTEPRPGKVNGLTGKVGTNRFCPTGVIVPTHTTDTDASTEWVQELLLEACNAYPFIRSNSSVVIDGEELTAQVRAAMLDLLT